jgi:uncharacterized protein YcaQ
MGGAQAQVMSAAQMSLWARTRGLRAKDVEAALWQQRSLAKVWCMRGTVYLVPSEDFAVFVRGVARRGDRVVRWMVKRGWPVPMIDRLVEALQRVMDRPLTRKEIAERIGGSFGPMKRVQARHGWGHKSEVDGLEVDGHALSIGGILSYACVRGAAIAGPPRGNEGTYVRPDAWLRKWRDLEVPEAEAELLRRYLRTHGPATAADFAWWTYVTAADARTIWERSNEEFASVHVDGRTAWVLREDLPVLERATIRRPNVRLLPFFDSFLLGHKEKGHLVAPKFYRRVYRPQGWLSPVVLVDGRVAGLWKHERKEGRLSVQIEPFGPLTSEVRDLIEMEAQDLGRFLEAEPVTVRFAAARTRLRT